MNLNIVIQLDKEQAERLMDILLLAQDEGPRDEGWKSEKLQELYESISKQIYNQENT